MSNISNRAFEIVPEVILSPRKRKRYSGRFEAKQSTPTSKDIGIRNEAFSSTPKKSLNGKRFMQNATNISLFGGKENQYYANHCLEEKSIFDIAQQKAKTAERNAKKAENPFEVARKPPKKKKKSEIEVACCFENPALNLAGPEKHLNPFEVVRDKQLNASPSPVKGFVNAALNIRGKDIFPNPFEIQRTKEMPELSNGIVNEAMENVESTFTIGLPFKPKIGYRIDFKNISANNLTPTKLFAEKLVFSPDVKQTAPRSLSIISEETLDIGQELDLYQLQLENSINEKKMRKSYIVEKHSYQQLTITKKQTDIVECVEAKNSETVEGKEPDCFVEKKEDNSVCKEFMESKEENLYCTIHENESTLADSSYNDDSFFKAPTPFVRNYRKGEEQQPQPSSDVKISRVTSKESINSVKSSETDNKLKPTVKSLIRNSIRKIMHSKASNKKVEKDCDNIPTIDEQQEHQTQPTTKLFDTLRYSLRRKEKNQFSNKETKSTISASDISIIDQSERTMKLKTNIIQTDYMKIEELTNEKKPSFRNSIRKSTRGVRNHIMKSVFHKNVENGYEFKK